MRFARRALKTTIAAESGILLAAMPIPFVAALASLTIVIGWATWKVVEHRQQIGSIVG